MKNMIRYITAYIIVVVISCLIIPKKEITITYKNTYMDENNIIDDDIIKNDNGIINNIPLGTTVGNIKSYITNGNNSLINDYTGCQKNNDSVLSTGDKLVINSQTYTLSVKGDVSGNGIISDDDIHAIAKHIVDNDITRDDVLLAADYNNDGNIKMNDVMKMLSTTSKQHKIHFINTGNSDSILLESNGHYGLVDTGRTTDGVEYYLNDIIGNNQKLDFIITTHPHPDHIGGIVNLTDYVDSSTTYYYGEWRMTTDTGDTCGNQYNAIIAMKEAGAKIVEIDNNNMSEILDIIKDDNPCMTSTKGRIINGTPKIALGEYNVKILNSEDDQVNLNNETEPDANKNSLIELITYNNYRILLAADMEIDDEERFLCTEKASNANECRNEKLGRVDIYKFGHHGSLTSNSIEFMDLLKPKTAVITAARFNHQQRNATDSYRYTEKYFNTTIYDTAFDDEEFVPLNTQDDNKKAIVLTFDNTGYTVTSSGENGNIDNAKFSTLSNYHDPVNPYWERINLFGTNGWYYYDSDISRKGLSLVNTFRSKETDPITQACYYFKPTSGVMQYGWNAINNRIYYFGPSSGSASGIMQTGTITVDDITYTLNDDNTCDNVNNTAGGYLIWNDGWLTLYDKYTYYYEENDKYVTGWKEIDGYFYYFEPSNGRMQTGWKLLDDVWYYLDTDGKMVTGWKKIGSKWYYFLDNGHMVSDICTTINNKDYCFDNNGVCTSGDGC